jgi:sugar phosphate isomerase/epimerase
MEIMKIGVSSYSFSRIVNSGAMKQIDVIAEAKKIGFDVLEFSKISVPEGKTLPNFAAELREEADKVGIDIENYTIGADFLRGSNGDIEAEIARVQAEVDVAGILGVPGMRHDASSGWPEDHKGPKSFEAALPRLSRGCRKVTEYAVKKGIKTMVENHGRFCQDSVRVEQLVTAVDHPNFGVLIDIGNFLCADDDPPTAVGRLMPYAFHCHAKDFHVKPGNEVNPGTGWFVSRGGNYLRGAIIGHGNVQLLHCLKIMKRENFQGVLSIEFEGMEDVLSAIRLGHENLRKLVDLAEKS